MYPADIPSDDRAPYPSPRGEYNQRVAPILALDSLTKRPKEILATETKLRLPIPRPMLTPLRSGNTDRYCDYHQEKGHYTNDYIQPRKQLKMEMALESRKLNHMVKDIRRGGKGPHSQDDPQPAKIINVISVNSVKDKKRKVKETTESWMNISITFLAISAEDVSEEPLIVEAEIKAGLRETQTDLVGFAREVSKPLGKIELEVCFGNGGLYMRNSMKFIVVRAPSPYNIILGRPNLKTLRAISSTIHLKMKFLTPKGVATVVTWTLIIVECRRLEKEQLVEVSPEEKGVVAVTEEVLVNLSFPDQPVTIGRGLSEAGVPRRIIEHALNVNPSLDPVCQKRRTFSMEKSRVVKNEVAEWVKAGIVRPVKYPTYISNPVLVKKGDGTWRMCIDFKNLNSACPKDCYPLLNIDCKVESVTGFKYNCFLNAYKGYHQIQMAEEDEEKMAFYTYHGTANPRKTKALADLQSPRTLKEMQSLSGKLAVLNRFLAKSAERGSFSANEKTHHGSPIIYSTSGKETLYAYLAVSAEAISVVLLTDRKGRQCLVQYVSRTPNEAGRNYAPMEKLALALIHMTRRLRRYFEAHPVKVITDQLIKNILNNTETSEKLAKYAVELGSYNITFIPRNTVKGQVLANFLSEVPKEEKEELYFRMTEVPLEKDDTGSWTLFTDGASSPKGLGAGSVLIGPSGIEYTYALRLTFPSINNEAEYEALLAGMIKYLAKAQEYASKFKSFSIENIPRNMNQKADVLSKLASVAFNHLKKEVLVEVLIERSMKGQEIHTIVEEEGDNWMTPIRRCLEEGIWPKDKYKARCLRAKIGQYAMESGILFKKGYLVPMLRCVGPLQANYVIWEIHMGSYGMHVGPRAVVRKAIKQGYYCPTMHEDAKKEERRETATVREARYKTNMEQYYNKKVRPAGFRPGEFVF
nr:hypothetical protein [Tanacetum cinerariifolium]